MTNDYLAFTLYNRILPYIFIKYKGLNPFFRFSKYEHNNKLNLHTDVKFFNSNGTEESQLTIIIYLNNCNSGETRFINVNNMVNIDIIPVTGKAVIFDQRIPHCAIAIDQSEVKYTMRTDIMKKNTSTPIYNQCIGLPAGVYSSSDSTGNSAYSGYSGTGGNTFTNGSIGATD